MDSSVRTPHYLHSTITARRRQEIDLSYFEQDTSKFKVPTLTSTVNKPTVIRGRDCVLGAVIKVYSEFAVFEQPDDLTSFYEATILVGELDPRCRTRFHAWKSGTSLYQRWHPIGFHRGRVATLMLNLHKRVGSRWDRARRSDRARRRLMPLDAGGVRILFVEDRNPTARGPTADDGRSGDLVRSAVSGSE